MQEKFQIRLCSGDELAGLGDIADYQAVFECSLPQEGFGVYIVTEEPLSGINANDLEQHAQRAYEAEKKRITEAYPPLKAETLVHDYDENGIPYFTCGIPAAVFGEPRRIVGRTLQEMRLRLEIAFDELVAMGKAQYHTAARSVKAYHDECICFCAADSICDEETDQAMLPERQTDSEQAETDRESAELREEFWELVELAVFGSEEAHQYARGILAQIIGSNRGAALNDFGNLKYALHFDAHNHQKMLLRRLDAVKPPDGEEFYRMLTQAIDIDRKFTNNSLAEKIGCSTSTLTRLRNGETGRPRKRLVLQIGAALGLSAEDFTRFVNAAGYHFPASRTDAVILDCLERGIADYDQIMTEAAKYDSKIYPQP